MGMRLFGSSSSFDKSCYTTMIDRLERQASKQPPNPNPLNWHLSNVKDNIWQIGRYLLINITYPDCTNYEGRKVLLFKDVTYDMLVKQKAIDPHFSSNKNFHSPIARFEPTQEGWEMGIDLVSILLVKE